MGQCAMRFRTPPKKEFLDELTEIILDEFDNNTICRGLTWAPREFDYFPSIKEMCSYLRRIPSENSKMNPVDCPTCNSTGYFVMDNGKNKAVAACEICSYGRHLSTKKEDRLLPLSEVEKRGFHKMELKNYGK